MGTAWNPWHGRQGGQERPLRSFSDSALFGPRGCLSPTIADRRPERALNFTAEVNPFRAGQWYKFALLRQVGEETSRARHADRELSREMRVRTWAKSWNEELLPLSIFADHKALLDDDEFCWTPDGAADFSIRTADGAELKIQSTMAYPEWEGSIGKQGGHVHKLEMVKYYTDGYSYPGGKVSEPIARSPYDDLEACRRGIANALKNKLRPIYSGYYLLIFASRCTYLTRELVSDDFTFEQAIAPAIEEAGNWKRVFEGLYVYDEYSFFEIKRSHGYS
jgi:hypothetical protein